MSKTTFKTTDSIEHELAPELAVKPDGTGYAVNHTDADDNLVGTVLTVDPVNGIVPQKPPAGAGLPLDENGYVKVTYPAPPVE